MTVGTPHFAFRDLSFDRRPEQSGPKHRCDVVPLVAQVIEVEHDDVTLTAVDARVLLEVRTKAQEILGHDRLLPPSRSSDLLFAVQCVERALVRVVAVTAPRLAHAGLSRPPCEGTGRPHSSAARAVDVRSNDLDRLSGSAHRRPPGADPSPRLAIGMAWPRRRPSSLSRTPPVAVRAYDLALRDLLLDEGPRATRDHVAHVAELLAEMIEVEDDRIRLAAIDASFAQHAPPEQLAQPGGSLAAPPSFV